MMTPGFNGVVEGDSIPFNTEEASSYNQKIHFLSKPSEQGDFDIFFSQKTEAGWTEWEPLTSVNTPHDERAPYLVNNEFLFFSSNRPNGYGEVDIYMATRLIADSWQDWSVPVNLGPTFNAEGDDYYFQFTTSGTCNAQLFFETLASNNGYQFEKCYDFDLPLLENRVGDSFHWNFGDGGHGQGDSITHCFNAPGDYWVAMDVTNKLSGKTFEKELYFLHRVPQDLEVIELNTTSKSALKTFRVSLVDIPSDALDIQYYWDLEEGHYTCGQYIEFEINKQHSQVTVYAIVTTQEGESYFWRNVQLPKS